MCMEFHVLNGVFHIEIEHLYAQTASLHFSIWEGRVPVEPFHNGTSLNMLGGFYTILTRRKIDKI